MATSEWLQFFQEAGIPPGPALGYAVAFVDNRIHKNMLLDLTRELMKDLGITAVGDVIAILRHAKVVHRQEMCRAASEALQPEGAAGAQRGCHGDQDHRDRDWGRERPRKPPGAPQGAAGRMIANSLRRDSNPRSAGISVTVANGAAGAELPPVAGKRRRVTAEMEGKYIISLPKGTTSKTRKILQLQAARGLGRTSVFERLGAEGKAAAAGVGKPSGVFSRLGDPADPNADPSADPNPDPNADAEALPYAGVLKKRRESPAAQDGAVSSSVSSLVSSSVSSPLSSPLSSSLSSSLSSPLSPELRPPRGCGKVSSSCSSCSVFRRLGRKPD